MNFLPENYFLVFQDAAYALSVGFLTGFINQILGIFLSKGRVAIALKDLLSSVIFTLLLFSYVVSFANYNTLRWYHTISAIVGFICFSPCFDEIGSLVFTLIGKQARVTGRWAASNAAVTAKGVAAKFYQNNKKITQIDPDNSLQSTDVMLYN